MSSADAHGRRFCRRLWPGDRSQFLGHLMRLDDDSRRERFGMAVAESFLADHASKALGLKGVVYGCFIDGELRAVAEMHPAQAERAGERRYEAAFSVERAYRRQGIASELMSLLLRAARNRSAAELFLLTQPNNLAMRALAQKFDGHMNFRFGQVEAHFESGDPTPWSVGAEVLDDVRDLPSAVLDWQRRFWLGFFPSPPKSGSRSHSSGRPPA